MHESSVKFVGLCNVRASAERHIQQITALSAYSTLSQRQYAL